MRRVVVAVCVLLGVFCTASAVEAVRDERESLKQIMEELPQDKTDKLLKDEYGRLVVAGLKVYIEEVTAAKKKVAKAEAAGQPLELIAVEQHDVLMRSLDAKILFNRAAAVDDILFRRRLERAVAGIGE
jgi:hypothetical protein